MECYSRDEGIIMNCERCGKGFKVNPRYHWKRFCSIICQNRENSKHQWLTHKEQCKIYNKKWRKANPEKVIAHNREYLQLHQNYTSDIMPALTTESDLVEVEEMYE